MFIARGRPYTCCLLMRVAANVSMEKNETTSISKPCWHIYNIEECVTGNLFYLQLPQLPTALPQVCIMDDQCSYMADFFEP